MKRFFKLTILYMVLLFVASVLLDILYTAIISHSSDRNKVESVSLREIVLLDGMLEDRTGRNYESSLHIRSAANRATLYFLPPRFIAQP